MLLLKQWSEFIYGETSRVDFNAGEISYPKYITILVVATVLFLF